MKKALILIDFINEIANKKGKMFAKGYYNYCIENNTILKAQKLLNKFRKNNDIIIHVRIAFTENYIEQPKNSPLFGKAKEFEAFKLNSFGTEFIEELKPINDEVQIIKNRVNAFHGTNLDVILKNNKIEELYVCGIATDLAVSSTVRDAHDKDYIVNVVEDCCGAGSNEDHLTALLSLKKISKVIKEDEMNFKKRKMEKSYE